MFVVYTTKGQFLEGEDGGQILKVLYGRFDSGDC